jgi:hypothetical protein
MKSLNIYNIIEKSTITKKVKSKSSFHNSNEPSNAIASNENDSELPRIGKYI